MHPRLFMSGANIGMQLQRFALSKIPMLKHVHVDLVYFRHMAVQTEASLASSYREVGLHIKSSSSEQGYKLN